MANTRLLLILFFACIFCLSCSGGSNPVMSPFGDYADETRSQESPLIADYKDSSHASRYPGVWGAWKIRVNPKDLSYEITPARNALAIGDIFDADLSQFLMVSPCSNCMRISSIKMSLTPPEYYYAYSTLDITFEMRHPFLNITTRPDLHGFDVRLIIVAEGDLYDYPAIMVMNPDGSVEPALFCDEFLLNPDGFTSHYDNLVSDERYFIGGAPVPGNLNPFLRFFEDYSTGAFDPQAPSGHNVMPVGPTIDSRTAYINLNYGLDELYFYAIADIAYGQSAVLANRTSPQYYLPAFNRTEAWRVEYWIENNNLDETDPTSTADVVVQVFDWQQGATVDPSYPNPSNLSGIRESSNVLRVEMNVPGYQDDLIIATTPESGTGTPTNPLQYRLTITNENLSDNIAWGLLAIRDELHGHEAPSGRYPVPESPAGFPYSTQDIRDYTCYYIIKVNYPNPPDDFGFILNGELFVYPTSFYSPSSDVVVLAYYLRDPSTRQYEYAWDFDYDGVTFDVDGTGFPFEVVSTPDPGPLDVGLRIRTTSVPPREIIFTIPIYVDGIWTDETSDTGLASTTYYSRERAMEISEDGYIVTYTEETAGKRDICLIVCDRISWQCESYNLTESFTGSFYNPSIELIEDDPNAGLYVAFTNYDSGEPDLHSIDGTLDGLEYTQGAFRIISNGSTTENNVCLYYYNDQLLAYYAKQDAVLGNEINVSSWDFSPAGWTFRNIIHVPMSGDQNHPSIAVDDYYGNLYCAWHDARDYTSNAYDLYLTSSSDGILFADSEKISASVGFVDDVYPSLAIIGRQIGVAYLMIDYGATTMRTHVAMLDSVYGANSILDHEITIATSRLHTIPSIATACEGRFMLSFGSYDEGTDDLYAHIVELVNDTGWTLDEDNLYETNAGTVPLGAANIFPGVVNRLVAFDTAVDNLIVYRTFSQGDTDSTTPFPMRLGEMQFVSIITEGREFEFSP